MNKKIENNAKIVLTDSEFNSLKEYLNKKQLNKAKLFIYNLLDNKELTLELTDNFSDRNYLIKDIQNLDTILDEIFNLYEDENESEQIKHVT